MSLPAESTGAAVTQVDTGVTESPSTTSIDTTPPPTSSQRPHRGNLVLGAALIALGVMGFGLSWLTADAGTLKTVCGVGGIISGAALLRELGELLRNSSRRYSPLSFVPATGALLVCAAALFAALIASSASKNWPIIGILLTPFKSFPVDPTVFSIFSCAFDLVLTLSP